jgi:4-carboxymuconolactone decarboxylase
MTSPGKRFSQLEIEDLDADQRRAIEPVLEFIGGIVGPFNSTLRSAEILERSFALGDHLLFGTTLPRRLVEMAVLMRARVESSEFEWYSHHQRGLAEGLSEAVCEALREGRRPADLAEDEAVLFDFSVEAMKLSRVRDETFDRARLVFGERGVVELTYLLGFYGMISLVLRVAEVDAPGSPRLPAIDDPFPLTSV